MNNTSNKNWVYKLAGIISLCISPVLFVAIPIWAFNIVNTRHDDIQESVPALILIAFVIPAGLGMFVFGYQCLKGEYNEAETTMTIKNEEPES